MIEQTTQNPTLKTFVGGLSSVQQDRFVRVMNELQRRGSAQEVQKLHRELAKVKARLNEIEDKRKKQKSWLSDVRSLLHDIEGVSAATLGQSLLQLRILVGDLDAEAERTVAESKPTELLQQKAELKKKIQKLASLAELASNLGSEVKSGD